MQSILGGGEFLETLTLFHCIRILLARRPIRRFVRSECLSHVATHFATYPTLEKSCSNKHGGCRQILKVRLAAIFVVSTSAKVAVKLSEWHSNKNMFWTFPAWMNGGEWSLGGYINSSYVLNADQDVQQEKQNVLSWSYSVGSRWRFGVLNVFV